MGEDDRFHPDSLAVALGDSVTWVNEDAEPHTSTSGANCIPDGDWDSGSLGPGDSFTYVTNETETFAYHCTFHCAMGMVGVLVVTEPTPAQEESWGRLKASYRIGRDSR
jgi:plastocyanin